MMRIELAVAVALAAVQVAGCKARPLVDEQSPEPSAPATDERRSESPPRGPNDVRPAAERITNDEQDRVIKERGALEHSAKRTLDELGPQVDDLRPRLEKKLGHDAAAELLSDIDAKGPRGAPPHQRLRSHEDFDAAREEVNADLASYTEAVRAAKDRAAD
jgi:hypothetical protein